MNLCYTWKYSNQFCTSAYFCIFFAEHKLVGIKFDITNGERNVVSLEQVIYIYMRCFQAYLFSTSSLS